MYNVILEWPYCPDGVERFNYGRRKANKTLLGGSPVGPHYRYRSRRRLITQHKLDLEDPLVLRFVNARKRQGLSEFFARFGLLGDGFLDESEAHVRKVLRRQEELRFALYVIGGVAANEAISRANLFLRTIRLTPSMVWGNPGTSGAPRLALHPQTLFGFMCMEVAAMAANGNQLTRCAHAKCKKWFVTGSRTGRRFTAKYCADKCRVAAARARAR